MKLDGAPTIFFLTPKPRRSRAWVFQGISVVPSYTPSMPSPVPFESTTHTYFRQEVCLEKRSMGVLLLYT
jgi:hypothetical protein